MSISGENRPGRPKIDLSQKSLFPVATVSQNLQDRLGLAKVKYEKAHPNAIAQKPARERRRKPYTTGADIMSDPAPDILESRFETPFPSSPLPASSFSKEFPRSSRTHAYSFQPESTYSTGLGSRKRTRSDSTTDGPSKVARTSSWKRSHQLPESSPYGGHRAAFYHGRSASFAPRSGSAAQDFQFPPFPDHPDRGDDPDLPSNNIPIISSSMASSSPPRTPPPRHATLSRNGKGMQKGEDGADLLLYLANSPTPANIAPGSLHPRDFLPSTPPSQHAAFASLTQTPQFNFADFVNVTPSPAQRTRGGRTPGSMVKTPLATKEMKKRLNFDSLAPPSAGSPARNRDKDSKPVLQLGEELRP
ncbi:hypothetical protein FQN54_007212 [Arachnomyces sp. PD_36]|nr:hypothetical protein FQN54_007212 [Arachnomyces sp. PD_36]